ncbi:MAG TPA: type 2 lanthipeptide synthetase LanM family protein [Ktedonobacteraceae bacterium]|nr:type 2 lanthipeptide synthetase LanM family protein [Ktedonobacteraceae bacterium]
MKEVGSRTETATRTDEMSAQWYLAATLRERLSRQARVSQPPATAEAELAARRLKKWQHHPAFHQRPELFAQRLAQDGLSEEALAAQLGQRSEEVRALYAEQPAWLTELLEAFSQSDPAVLACLPLETIGHDPASDAAFLALKPLLARSFARLQAGVAELQQRYPRPPFDPRLVAFQLLPHFLDRLLNRPAKVLILELNVARVQNRLQGETPQERYLYFLQQLGQPAKMLTLLEEYPVLARQLVEMCERWVTRGLELLQRLCADWQEIRATFAPGEDPGLLREIREGAGDAHGGERSVTILTWETGLRVVYKPRSLAVDVHFQETLAWLNAQGCQPAFRLFKLLNKTSYGWYECVTAHGCTSQEEVERFYQRMGGYLALLYVLEGTDFHAENLLAVGEDPMLIDLETLFTPHTVRYEGPDRYGYELLTHTVRRVGLLPHHQWLDEQTQGTDLSGLGASTNQRAGTTVNVWASSGTDEMRVHKASQETRFADHRPTLQGAEVEALQYEQHIISGFTTVYRLLLNARAELVQTILPRFAGDEVRVLLRPTYEYARLLSDASHPDVLRDALDRDWLFHRLWLGVEEQPHLAHLIAAECVELQGGDIPKFTTTPASRDLCAASGTRLLDFFPLTGLELVNEGIQRLSEQDLERQIWIISASFTCAQMNLKTIKPQRNLQLQRAEKEATPEQLIAGARAIGDRLQQLALLEDGAAGWLVVNLLAGVEWTPVPAGPDLYNGLPGITIFLAYLGLLSGEERYTILARQALKAIQMIFSPAEQNWSWRQIGAFDGVGSLIYLYSHLGALWHEPDLFAQARKALPLVAEMVSGDEVFDMLAGSAGAIAALLSLHAVAPDEQTLATAVQCGDHLLSHARSMARGIAWGAQQDHLPLAGLSHGTAGIALNLLRLAEVSGEARFHTAALQALEYERGIYSAEKQNWPDLRGMSMQLPDGETPSYKYMTAWCHGAAGVGMGRLAGLPYHDDAAVRAEIAAALRTTLNEGFSRNHSLCHGDMGNLEPFILASRLLPSDEIHHQLAGLQAVLLQNIQAQGWVSGIPHPIETPGLMLGMSGTGYALLRLAAPERVPSLLVLAPPPARF